MSPGRAHTNPGQSLAAAVIELRGITKRFGPVEVLSDVNLSLHGGRVHSLAGENGAGKSTLVKILGGIHQPDSGRILKDGIDIAILSAAEARRQGIAVITKPDRGEIQVKGRDIQPRSPRHAMRLGISFLPEDRHQQGLVLQFPIRANETLPILRQLADRFGLVDRSRETQIARDFASRMRVVASGVEQLTKTLSGGNQQKVLLAKWLIPSPKVLILEEPTRGIDVGAKAEIHRLISNLAAQGIAVILVSDDAQEVIGMADRIIVFRGGRIAAESVRANFDRETILLSASQTSRGDNASPLAASPRSAETTTVSSPGSARRFITGLAHIRELGLVLALLLICSAVTLREPRFLQWANLEQVALSATLVCMVIGFAVFLHATHWGRALYAIGDEISEGMTRDSI